MEVEICERDRTINQTMTTGMLGDGQPAGNVAAGVILPQMPMQHCDVILQMVLIF